MTKKKSTKPKGETRTSFKYPSLHNDVVNEASLSGISAWFCRDPKSKHVKHEYQTHVMGKFQCAYDTCPTHGWGSKKVAVLIKGYVNNGYSAEVFNQRCKTCKNLGKFTLDEASYVDRVAYRVQKWAGVSLEMPVYDGKTGLPHKRELCEDCMRGVCSRFSDGEET